MKKEQVLGLVTKIATSLKRIFPLKTQVATDIESAKTELKAYADEKVTTATNGGASTTYVDEKVATLNTAIATYKAGMADLIDTEVSKLGTFIGVSNKYSTLPTKDQLNKDVTAGDFVHLTAKDGTKKKGLYRYDGTAYAFISGDPAVIEILESLKAVSLDDTVDDKFVTPKWVKDYGDAQEVSQDEVDGAVGE